MLALNPFLLRPRQMKSLEEAGSLQEKGALFGPGEGGSEGVIRGPPDLGQGAGQRHWGPVGCTAVLLMVQPPSRRPG